MSHVKSFEINKFSGYLSRINGVLKVHRGKMHEYMGIDLDRSEKLMVNVSMIIYIDNVLQKLPKNMGATESTLDSDQLFKVCNEKNSI